jgi:rare lipoprotein A
VCSASSTGKRATIRNSCARWRRTKTSFGNSSARSPLAPLCATKRGPGRTKVICCALLIAAMPLQLPSGNAVAADRKPDECGLASIYSGVSEETASGEDTRTENLTAAHRSLPFGTQVQVDNQENGRSAVVRITDRGPFLSGRIIDVPQIAARDLGISGLTQVCLKILVIPENRAVGG